MPMAPSQTRREILEPTLWNKIVSPTHIFAKFLTLKIKTELKLIFPLR